MASRRESDRSRPARRGSAPGSKARPAGRHPARSVARSRPTRKPARATAPRQDSLLDSVLQTSLAGLAVLRGKDFRFQIVNPAYQAIDPKRKLVGRTFAEGWPETATVLIPVLRRILRGGKPFHARDFRFDLARGEGGVPGEAYFTFTFQRIGPDASGEPGILVTAVETTADVLARRRVNDGEARLHLALEASGSGLWEWDLATGGNEWSDGLWDLYGVDRARPPSYAAWRESLYPADRERAEAAVRDAAARGEPLDVEYRVGSDATDARWLVARGAPVRDGSGKIVRYRGVTFDVTVVRRAAQLAAERDRFDALEEAVAQLPIGVVLIDAPPGGAPVIVAHNEAYRRIVASAPSDPTPIANLRYAIHRPDRVTAVPPPEWPGPRAARTGETVHDQELHLRRSDGTWRVLSVSAAPVGPTEHGRSRRAVAVLLDVTDRNHAEHELRASEARFRDVAALAGEYVFEMDARGVVTYISEAAETVLGWRPEEVVGRSSFDFMDPEEVPRSGAFLAERVARKEPFMRLSQVALHRSGRRVYLEISAVPIIAADGELAGYRGAAMDVTERREAEAARARLKEQLAQAQKMEVVGRLAGGVAHDFNNLLTVILTCGLQLQDDLREGRPGDAEAATDVVAAAQRAADLTRQLLAFARREVAVPEEVDLNEVVRVSRKLLGRVIGEDVRLAVELQEGLWQVRADRGLLGQVVMNLAVNARDAMPRGGTLHIATANRRLQPGGLLPDPEMSPGDWVEIAVRDDGVGMAPEVLAHLFEPFYTTKPVGAGTGLGLATVFGIVKQAGGAIAVSSEPGKGTEFRVFLPAFQPGAKGTASRRVDDRGGTESILVVEDEPKVREVTTLVLRAAGYRVHVASSGEEAMAWLLAGGGPVDLVVTDVVMPGMGGSELASQVEVLRPGTRVLYVSGFTQDATLRHGVTGDGLEFLAKPFTPEKLRARVRAVLDRG
jgi:two-component system, cell cycle sensor histidine kinase and response regulator CckA